MQTKRKLRTWVKVTLTLITIGLLTTIVAQHIKQQQEYYNQCDQALGYHTTYYTCRQYQLNK